MKKSFKVALVGNPNCGKTSIFNALTGARRHVGNYPGVTVENISGNFSIGDFEIELIDLPGVYSLSSSSPEENIVFNELTIAGIDLILNVIDSSIPQRSLYLTTQIAELHIPMLIVFNMGDDAAKKGIKFDIEKLETYFGSPIVRTVGRNFESVRPLLDKLRVLLENPDSHGVAALDYGCDIESSISALAERIDNLKIERFSHIPSRFFAIKLLEKDSCAMRIKEFAPLMQCVDSHIAHLRKIRAVDGAKTFMADRRYAMLSGACRDSVITAFQTRRRISDRIDSVVTNKFLGLPIFLFILYLAFYFTFVCAEPLMGWIESAFAQLAEFVKSAWPEAEMPYLRALLTDGVIGGVGGVLVFLPNIVLLFLAIGLLEQSGYMSRAAFVMDGIMRRFGLQGRSFVPLVLGFGCNVPAIMATRSIESQRDRKTTIMILPFISCGARLPIYALIIPAFFAQNYRAAVMWGMYAIGVVMALGAALLLKRTIYKGGDEVYLMELPAYRLPTLRDMFLNTWDRAKSYLHKAGTIILAASILLFIANTYPVKKEFSKDYDAMINAAKDGARLSADDVKTLSQFVPLSVDELSHVEQYGYVSDDAFGNLSLKAAENSQLKSILEKSDALEKTLERLENEKSAEAMAYTISGRVGRFVEPLFKPIGFDWKLATASIGALAAKEIFVSQLGILYAEGQSDENSDTLRARLAKNYTPL